MLRPLAVATLLLSLAAPAWAHFVQLLPSVDVLPEGGEVALSLMFTHPFDGGPVMQMDRPVRFGMLRGGAMVDLSDRLIQAPVGGAMAWAATVDLPEPGPAQFYVQPQPYWEPAEGKYIIHYTKVLVDAWASGDGWDTPVGLPVEIVALTRPTGLWSGNSFTGIVTQAGQPVPFAEIEVEFVNDGSITAPNDAFVTQVIKADANGTFTYAMPRPGWWGFAALIEATEPATAPDGTEVPVELGGLIWVKTTAMGAE